MGFGHRIYKSYDPRGTIIKEVAHKLLAKHKVQDPLFDLAQEMEEVALTDPYFKDRKLYPNVDFYWGSSIGDRYSKNMERCCSPWPLPGWIATAELHQSPQLPHPPPRRCISARPNACSMPLTSVSRPPKQGSPATANSVRRRPMRR